MEQHWWRSLPEDQINTGWI